MVPALVKIDRVIAGEKNVDPSGMTLAVTDSIIQYGLEEASGVRVLELVEGPTLDERVRTGPAPLDEALRIARQIAGALEAAHDLGIVHRDLKRSNRLRTCELCQRPTQRRKRTAVQASRWIAPAFELE